MAPTNAQTALTDQSTATPPQTTTAPPPVTLDMSTAQPIQSAPAPVALDMSTAQPLSTESVLRRAFFGSNTAAGAATPQPIQNEESGLSDVFHGDIRKGLGEVWAAEKPHVIAGSNLEKAIQVVDPNFRGEGTQPANEIQNALAKPPIDAAQFIDKKTHPIAKAIAETAQSMASPQNVATMVATGGMGLVESPAALGMASRLLSAGFGAQAIAQMYANSKAFKEAYDKGDTSDALYQMTHAVLSGTVAALSTTHAVSGEQLPVASDLDRRVGNAVSDTVSGAVSDAGGAIRGKVGAGVKAVGGAAGIGLTPIEALTKAVRPGGRDAANFEENAQVALPRLAEANKVTPIKNLGDLSDAAHKAADDLWKNEVKPQIEKHANETISGKSVADAIRNGVLEGDKDLFEGDADVAEDFAKKFDGDMTVQQAADRMQSLNRRLSSLYKMPPEARYAATAGKPELGALEDAADSLRQELNTKLESLGEKDPSGLRKQYGALKQMERLADKRSIVYDRQAPLNISQVLSAAGGIGEAAGALFSGHPLAAMAGGIPFFVSTLARKLNAPESLIQSALKESIPNTPQTNVPSGAAGAPAKVPVISSSVTATPPATAEEKREQAPITLDMSTATPIQRESSENLGDDRLQAAAEALLPHIAFAEGADNPRSLPARANNPTDISLPGKEGIQSSGPGATKITKFATREDGEKAAAHDIMRKLKRQPNLTIRELAKMWAPSDYETWAENVARHAGLQPESHVVDLLNNEVASNQ